MLLLDKLKHNKRNLSLDKNVTSCITPRVGYTAGLKKSQYSESMHVTKFRTPTKEQQNGKAPITRNCNRKCGTVPPKHSSNPSNFVFCVFCFPWVGNGL
jgi:hypothetical protein